MEIYNISEKLVLKALWFACASAPHTFERTRKSKSVPIFHLWRIFTGKLGELFFASFIKEKTNLNFNFQLYEKNALSIFWGKQNVDSYDLIIKDKTLDIKTLPEPSHRYLIIPKDQFLNQPKDYYLAVKIYYPNKLSKEDLFNKSCIDLYLFFNKTKLPTEFLEFKAEILGFLPRNNQLWEYKYKDKICPEKECFRVHINKLLPLKKLIEELNN